MKRIALCTLVGIWIVATAAVVGAQVVTRDVSYRHDGVELVGHLAYDDAVTTDRPGILVIHEWWGLNDYARHRARQLAELGYVAFALDMYGDGKATAHPDQAKAWMQKITENVDQWRQRASAGLEVLKNQDHVDVDRLGAIGYCFGGATVQQLAYSGASLKGVVSFHGSPISPSPQDAGKTGASILLCHGAADPFVSFPSLKTYLEAMNGTDLDWQLVFYGGAKHSFTNPKADEAGMPALGYDKKADQRSWDHMKQFFEDLF